MSQDLADLDAINATHANVIRIDVGWATVEEDGPGTRTAWYVSKLNAFMAAAAHRKIKVVAILFTTPCWASSAPPSIAQGCTGDWWGRGVGWYPPTDPQNFARFAQWFTSTYGPDLAAVEIWNEPDIAASWRSSNPAGDYTRLLQAAYPAAKAGAANVPVLAGSLAGVDTTFLDQLYADGIAGSYNGISAHPYAAVDQFAAGLDQIHQTQLAHGDTSPLWVTEFGWSTASVSPADQAAWLTTAFNALAVRQYVRAQVVYEWRDGTAPEDSPGYGIQGKPAQGAFTRAIRQQLH